MYDMTPKTCYYFTLFYVKVLMSVFMNLARVDVLVEPSMHSLAESLVVLPGELAVRSCWALTTVAARSKAVSQRVADRLLFALTNCAEMDKLLVRVLLCYIISHCEVVCVLL